MIIQERSAGRDFWVSYKEDRERWYHSRVNRTSISIGYVQEYHVPSMTQDPTFTGSIKMLPASRKRDNSYWAIDKNGIYYPIMPSGNHAILIALGKGIVTVDGEFINGKWEFRKLNSKLTLVPIK